MPWTSNDKELNYWIGTLGADRLKGDGSEITNLNIALDEINNPTGNTSFSMANKQIKFTFQAPSVSDGAFEIEATGGFSGDLMHVHQHTGNPGSVDLCHFEAEDSDVVCVRIDSNGGTALHVDSGKAIFDGEIEGSLTNIGAGTNTAASSATYLRAYNGMVMSSALGHYVPVAGSIKHVTATFNVSTHTTDETVSFTVMKNGSPIAFCSAAISGVGTYTATNTYSRGSATFSAGDILSFYMSFSVGGANTVNRVLANSWIYFDT